MRSSEFGSAKYPGTVQYSTSIEPVAMKNRFSIVRTSVETHRLQPISFRGFFVTVILLFLAQIRRALEAKDSCGNSKCLKI